MSDCRQRLKMGPGSRTILVTGASGGIGQPLCRRLAAGGQRLVLSARTASALEQLKRQLPVAEAEHLVMPVDMTDDKSVSTFCRALADFGVRLDGVVLMPPQLDPTTEAFHPPEAWHQMFQRAFVGPVSLLQGALGAMAPEPERGKRCKVVIVSAITSVQVVGNYVTGGVLRSAWLAYAKVLAFAQGGRGIHVLTVSLGGVLSPAYRATLERRATSAGVSYEERLAQETSNIPLQKYGTPEEVAVVIEGLLSSFSDHLTGINILCDGGFTRTY